MLRSSLFFYSATALVSLTVLVSGCDRLQATEESSLKTNKQSEHSLTSILPNTFAGTYLAAQQAFRQEDLNASKVFLDKAFSLAEEQSVELPKLAEKSLLSKRLYVALLLDEQKTYTALANDLQKDEGKLDYTIGSILLVNALQEEQWQDAKDILSNMPPRMPWQQLLQDWVTFAETGDIPAMAPLASPSKEKAWYRQLMIAIMTHVNGDIEEAKTQYQALADARKAYPFYVLLQQLSLTEEAADQQTLVKTYLAKSNDGFSTQTAERLQQMLPLQREKALSKEQGLGLLYFALGTSLPLEKAPPLALLHFRLAEQLYPVADYINFMLGFTMQQHGLEETANAVLGNIPKESPFHNIAVQLRSRISWQDDNEAAAIELLEDNAKDDPDLLLQLGDLLRLQERLKPAIRYYTEAISASKTPAWQYYYARGATYEQDGNWDAAEADLKKALSLNPDEAQVLNYLGYGWVDRGLNLEEAEEMLLKAVQLSPRNGYIIDSVGWVYVKLGRIEEGVRYLERAVGHRPFDATINDHLGDGLWLAGREQEARFQWKRALSFDPEPELKDIIEDKLENGLVGKP